MRSEMVRKGGEEGDRQRSSQVAPVGSAFVSRVIAENPNQRNEKTPNAIEIMASPDLWLQRGFALIT